MTVANAVLVDTNILISASTPSRVFHTKAVAAWSAGLVRDSVGDYAIAFFFAGAIAILGGLMALVIRRQVQLV